MVDLTWLIMFLPKKCELAKNCRHIGHNMPWGINWTSGISTNFVVYVYSLVGNRLAKPGFKQRRFWTLPWPFVWAACTGTSSVGEHQKFRTAFPEIGWGSSQNARVQHPRYGYSGRYQFQLSSTTRMFPLYRSRFASSTSKIVEGNVRMQYSVDSKAMLPCIVSVDFLNLLTGA